MQEPSTPGLLENLVLWGTAAITWASGEVGRVMVAGAAGGFLRWIMEKSSRRRIRDGVVQVVIGAICANYLSNFILHLLAVPFGPIGDKSMGGFIAGLLGISLAKIVIAVVEARTRKLGEDDDDDNG